MILELGFLSVDPLFLAELTPELTDWHERQYPHTFVWYE